MAAETITPAAEKTTCAQKNVQSTLPIFKVVKSSAPKKRTRKFLQALQRPKPPPEKIYPVTILANGLVNTGKTPDYLTAAAKRNSLESPLLRLPSTVRMKIWEYAMGGNDVEIKLRSTEDASVSTKGHPGSESIYQGYSAIPGPSDRKTKKLRTAFRLPEVCRSVYRETAILGYTLNTFVFVGEVSKSFGREDGPDGAMEGWTMERIPAQLSAIKTIRPHWMNMLDYIHKDNTRTIKQFYPGLRKVLVPKRTVSVEANAPDRGPVRKLLRQQAKNRILTRVKELEGDDVEVMF